MPNYFVVTRGPAGPVGSIYHDEPPKMERERKGGVSRLHTGAPVIGSPMEIPASLAGRSISELLEIWRDRAPIRVAAAGRKIVLAAES